MTIIFLLIIGFLCCTGGFIVGRGKAYCDIINVASDAMKSDERVSLKEALLDQEAVMEKWDRIVVEYFLRFEDDIK